MSFMFEYFFFSNAMCSCAITKIPNIDAIVCNVTFVILRLFLPAACIFSFFFCFEVTLFCLHFSNDYDPCVFSGEGSHQSGNSEDRTPSAMARAVTVHVDTNRVMYFA